jgi:hypothetical protein
MATPDSPIVLPATGKTRQGDVHLCEPGGSGLIQGGVPHRVGARPGRQRRSREGKLPTSPHPCLDVSSIVGLAHPGDGGTSRLDRGRSRHHWASSCGARPITAKSQLGEARAARRSRAERRLLPRRRAATRARFDQADTKARSYFLFGRIFVIASSWRSRAAHGREAWLRHDAMRPASTAERCSAATTNRRPLRRTNALAAGQATPRPLPEQSPHEGSRPSAELHV